jgi:hypothetical protein
MPRSIAAPAGRIPSMPLHRRPLPRFGLKDLLISTALIAIGLAVLRLRFAGEPLVIGWWLVSWFGGGALVGAGIGVPFGRTKRATLAGVFFQFMALAVSIFFGRPLMW